MSSHEHIKNTGTETRDSQRDSCTTKVIRTIHTEGAEKGKKSDQVRPALGWGGGHLRWEVTWAQKSSLESEFESHTGCSSVGTDP